MTNKNTKIRAQGFVALYKELLGTVMLQSIEVPFILKKLIAKTSSVYFLCF